MKVDRGLTDVFPRSSKWHESVPKIVAFGDDGAPSFVSYCHLVLPQESVFDWIVTKSTSTPSDVLVGAKLSGGNYFTTLRTRLCYRQEDTVASPLNGSAIRGIREKYRREVFPRVGNKLFPPTHHTFCKGLEASTFP